MAIEPVDGFEERCSGGLCELAHVIRWKRPLSREERGEHKAADTPGLPTSMLCEI